MIMELLLFITMIPLAFYDYKKRILPHDYMAITLFIAISMGYNQFLATDIYNVIVTLCIVAFLLYLGFAGKWGMGDTKLCLILLLAYPTNDFLYIIFYACIIGLILNIHHLMQRKHVGTPFGTYLTLAVFLHIIIK